MSEKIIEAIAQSDNIAILVLVLCLCFMIGMFYKIYTAYIELSGQMIELTKTHIQELGALRTALEVIKARLK